MAFKFRLAFYDEELLVHDARAIAAKYLKCVPYTPRMPCECCDAGLHWWHAQGVSLHKWLHISCVSCSMVYRQGPIR